MEAAQANRANAQNRNACRRKKGAGSGGAGSFCVWLGLLRRRDGSDGLHGKGDDFCTDDFAGDD